MVLSAKHHDGSCLWDAKLTDFNIMPSPFRRDIVLKKASPIVWD
jgi:alpha-L-fucosidase